MRINAIALALLVWAPLWSIPAMAKHLGQDSENAKKEKQDKHDHSHLRRQQVTTSDVKPKHITENPEAETSITSPSLIDEPGAKMVGPSDPSIPSKSTFGSQETKNEEEEEEVPTLPPRYYIKYTDGQHDSTMGLLKSFKIEGLKEAHVYHEFPEINTVVADLTDEEIDILEAHPSIQMIEEDTIVHALVHSKRQVESIDEVSLKVSPKDQRRLNLPIGSPTDAEKWQVVPWGIWMSEAVLAWGANVTGAGVTVCVLDSGVDATHQDLVGVTGENWYSNYSYQWLNYSDDANGHGTHCSGTVAGANNSIGVVGVAPDAKVYGMKFLNQYGSGYGSDAIVAAQKCQAAGADIISMSYGGSSYSYTEEWAYKQIASAGVMLIAAAGNSGYETYSYPASYPNVTSVAATDRNKNKASFSTYNDEVDISGPGVDVLSTISTGGSCYLCSSGTDYEVMSGTSMACPHVAGVAALLKSFKPTATAAEIIGAMESSAEILSTGSPNDSKYFGNGLVRAYHALVELNGGPLPMTNGCQSGEYALSTTLFTDNYPNETSYVIFKDEIPIQMTNGFSENTQYTETLCLPPDAYNWTIFDSHGDGVCCDFGEGNVSVAVNGLDLISDHSFAKKKLTVGFGAPAEKENKDICQGGGGIPLLVELTTDHYPEETSMVLLDDTGTVVWNMSSLEDDEYKYAKNTCLESNSCYELQVRDSYGDGIGPHYYFGNGDLEVTLGTESVHSGGDYGVGFVQRFGESCSCVNVTLSGRTDYTSSSYHDDSVLLFDTTVGLPVWDKKWGNYETYDLSACLDPTHCYEFSLRDGGKTGYISSYYSRNFWQDGQLLVNGTMDDALYHSWIGDCGQ